MTKFYLEGKISIFHVTAHVCLLYKVNEGRKGKIKIFINPQNCEEENFESFLIHSHTLAEFEIPLEDFVLYPVRI